MDGAAAKSEPVQRPGSDAGLLSALEELSNFPEAARTLTFKSTTAFGSTTPPISRRDNLEPQPTRVRRRGSIPATDAECGLSDASAETGKDSIRIVPLSLTASGSTSSGASPEDVLRELADLPPAEDWAPQIIPELVEPELPEESVALSAVTNSPAVPPVTSTSPKPAFDLPDHLSSALAELADTVAPTAVLPNIPVTRRPGLMLWSVMTVALVSCGTVAGFLWGRSGANASPESASFAATVESTAARGDADQPAVIAPPGKLPPVSGFVHYTDGSGKLKSDVGALILLLPAANASGLRLDARPLREGQSGPAKVAVESALAVLGATITRAADDGSFSVPRLHSGEMKLLVISRHASRPDSEPVAAVLIEQLAHWFDSPTHITGRLSVKQADVSAVSDADKSGTLRIEITM